MNTERKQNKPVARPQRNITRLRFFFYQLPFHKFVKARALVSKQISIYYHTSTHTHAHSETRTTTLYVYMHKSIVWCIALRVRHCARSTKHSERTFLHSTGWMTAGEGESPIKLFRILYTDLQPLPVQCRCIWSMLDLKHCKTIFCQGNHYIS